MDFWKLQGAGNDFILIDNRKGLIKNLSSLARTVCHRNFGVGADGLIAVEVSDISDINMAFFNSDGSMATMCGNGIRCFSKFVRDQGILLSDSFSVETGDGNKQVIIKEQNINASLIQVEMGKAKEIRSMEILAEGTSYKLIFMHIGVPHSVLTVDGDLIDYTNRLGPQIEKKPAFPDGTNVNFIRVTGDSKLTISTWERGAGRTLACGTGACASALAALRQNLVNSPVRVKMPGGEVIIHVASDGALSMEGWAQLICKGTLYLPFQ